MWGGAEGNQFTVLGRVVRAGFMGEIKGKGD